MCWKACRLYSLLRVISTCAGRLVDLQSIKSHIHMCWKTCRLYSLLRVISTCAGSLLNFKEWYIPLAGLFMVLFTV